MKFALSLGFAAIAAFVCTAADLPTGYASHQTITFSGYAGESTLTNFPVLIKLPANTFKRADRQDLAVTDADGNRLAYEIDAATDAEVLAWVKVPELTKETAITAWFGKTEADEKDFVTADVWTNNYAAVWHLNEDAVDSTGHGLAQHAYKPSTVSVVSGTDSLVGRSLKLDSNDEAGLWFNTPKAGFIDAVIADGERLTVTGWLKPSVIARGTKAMRLFCWKGYTEYQGFDTFQNTDGKFYMRGKTKSLSWITAATIPWSVGSWCHLAASFDNQTFSAYLNGAAMAADSSSKTSALQLKDENNTNCSNLGFGNVGSLADGSKHNDYQYPFANGQLDELRLFNGVASADWIKAEYDTVKTGTFAVYGPIQYEDVTVDGTWIGTGATASWSDPANWQDRQVASGPTPTVTFAAEGTDEQAIDLDGAEVRVLKLVQSDARARTIAGGRMVFARAGDIEVTGGSLAFGQDFQSAGLVKKGAGELRFENALTVSGDLTVEAGTVAVDGGASVTVSGEGKDWTYTPEKAVYVTHLGLARPQSGVFSKLMRVSVKQGGPGATPIMQVRFSEKASGTVWENDYTYLRLSYPMALEAGTDYTVNVSEQGFSGRLLVADLSLAHEVRGTVTVADGAVLKLATAALNVSGLTGAGRIVATRPAQIDLTLSADQTFTGTTEGPLGLVKRSSSTLDLTGTGLFSDGVTCRDGYVRVATDATIDRNAMLLFGDGTGENKTGKFVVAADNAVLSNPIGVTEMTTTALTAQGVWTEGGNTLTVTGTEVSDQDSELRVKDWKPGQFALHAHANAEGSDPTLVFASNTVSYLDVSARVDGDAARPTTRPANRIVIDDVNAPSKVRKFTVQNNTADALGGTVEFTAARPFTADWLDVVGYQTKVVMAPGAKVRADTQLRFNASTPSWEPISANDVDWTIGDGAVLAANGFPSTLEYTDVNKVKGSVLRMDGGTLKMNHHVASEEPREIFLLGERVPVEISEKGATIDLVPEQSGATDAVSIAAPISGEGGLTLKGDATRPEVLVTGSLGYDGATILDQVTLSVTNGEKSIAALGSQNGVVMVGEDAAVVVRQVTGECFVKSGAGALKLSLEAESAAASAGNVTVAEGTFGLEVGTVTVGPALVTEGDFEPTNSAARFHADPSGDGSHDKRCKRDAAYFTTNFSDWSFGPTDTDGSGLCCNASYFSNNQQIDGNQLEPGVENRYAVFLRKTSSVGPGVISRDIVTEKDNTTVIVTFHFNVRAYGNNDFCAKIGVLFDDEPVYATRTRYSKQKVMVDGKEQDEFKTWDVCTFEVEVPKAGSHRLAFTATDVDVAGKDCEALLDNVMVGFKTMAAEGAQERLGGLVLDVAEGAKLDLGDGLNVRMEKLFYKGKRVSGTISAATHPEFVTGKGKVRVKQGLVLLFRRRGTRLCVKFTII